MTLTILTTMIDVKRDLLCSLAKEGSSERESVFSASGRYGCIAIKIVVYFSIGTGN